MGLDPANWMSHLHGQTRVIDSYIPGSHDASAYLTGDTGKDLINEGAGSITQSGSYTAQLNAGSRYFDMRCIDIDGKIWMKHGSAIGHTFVFQPLKQVLDQIYKFHLAHPQEFFFLDFDFGERVVTDKDFAREIVVSDKIADIVESILTLPKLAIGHVSPDRVGYNTNLTWATLRENKAPFICTWSLGGSGRYWQAMKDEIYIDCYDNFDDHQPARIITLLNEMHGRYVKNYTHYSPNQEHPKRTGRLLLTQLINTPGVSPLMNPANRDLDAKDIFGKWLLEKKNGDKLGIVKLDFINVGYKREIIEHIIRMNKFTTPPDLPQLKDPIHYTDTVRLRTQDNRYISWSFEKDGDSSVIKPSSRQCRLTLVDTPSINCNFILRDYDFSPNKLLPYSGNLAASTLSSQGNFRMIPIAGGNTGVPSSTTVISVDVTMTGLLYWGQPWAVAGNMETFSFFDPNDLNNNTQLYSGSRVLVRSLLKATDSKFIKSIDAMGENIIRYFPLGPFMPFGGVADAIWKSPTEQRFWFIGRDPDPKKAGVPRVYGSSPGTLLADEFVIEKVL